MQNLELAWDAAARIKSAPSSFRMRFWGVPYGASGYTACLAGHTLLAAGHVLVMVNTFIRPDLTVVEHPGREARDLLGLTDKEYGHGIHFWKCNVFCENIPEDRALGNFLELVLAEESRRLELAAVAS